MGSSVTYLDVRLRRALGSKLRTITYIIIRPSVAVPYKQVSQFSCTSKLHNSAIQRLRSLQTLFRELKVVTL